MARKSTEWFVANESFATEDGRIFGKDRTRVRGDDAVFKIPGMAALFKPLAPSQHGAPDVEQATAAPGERRPRTRRKRVTKAKPKPAASTGASNGPPNGGGSPADEGEPEPKPGGVTLASLKGE